MFPGMTTMSALKLMWSGHLNEICIQCLLWIMCFQLADLPRRDAVMIEMDLTTTNLHPRVPFPRLDEEVQRSMLMQRHG